MLYKQSEEKLYKIYSILKVCNISFTKKECAF